MTKLPKSFLSRIAGYPPAVQDALSQTLTPDLVVCHVEALHGTPVPADDRFAGLLDSPADALLTRLIQSGRFAERVRALFGALRRSGDPEAAELVAAESRALVAALATPGAPYVWKLAEFARAAGASDSRRLSPEEAQTLVELVALHRLTAPGEGTGQEAGEDAAITLARALCAAGEQRRGQDETGADPGAKAAGEDALPGGWTRACAALLETLRSGTDILADEIGPVPPEHAGYARARLAASDVADLGWLDRGTIDRVAATGGFVLAPPVRIALHLSDPILPAAEARGRTFREAGLVVPDGARADATLTLRGDLEVSPILLAHLATAGIAGPSLPLLAAAAEEPSWRREIGGLPGARPATGTEVGRFDPAPGPTTADAADPAPLRIEAQPAGTAGILPAADIPAADAYAFVVRLDGEPTLPAWLNLDRCLAVEGIGRAGLAALARQVRAGAFDRATLRKPVLLVGAATPNRPDWLIEAVARHWVYGGGFATTPVALDYRPAEGRFTLSRPGDVEAADLQAAAEWTGSVAVDALTPDPPPPDRLTRMMAAPFATLPLGTLASGTGEDALPGCLDWIDHGLVLFGTGLGVVAPGGPVPDDAILRVARTLAPDRTTPDLRAAAMRAGRVTRSLAGTLDPAVHWPVEHLLSRFTARPKLIETLITGFAEAPSPALARRILTLLADPDTAALDLGPALERFAEAIAAEPDILPELPADAVAIFLEHVRTLPRIDRVAPALAVLAPDIVGARPDLVIPLMEVLATGLAPQALEATHAGLVEALLTRPLPGDVVKQMRSRLAAVGQRYGGPASLARMARLIGRQDPRTLADPRLLRHLQALEGDPALAPLARIAGHDLEAAIARAGDMRDSFRDALAAGDRDRAEALLADAGRLSDLDVTGWMDGLRGFSNELRAIALPASDAVPAGGGLQRRKLAAAIFRDRPALEALDAGGFLDDGSELSALCLNILGRNAALNAHLARRFEGTGIPPVEIAGESVAAVFAHAAAATQGATADAGTGRVSVVVSAFDPDPDLLALSLGSLRAQSHDDVEILLVDDASGPEGRAAIDAACAADPAIRLIRLTENSGPYIGRNRAIAEATGDFVAIQDADDWSHPDRFARQVAAFREAPTRQLVTTRHVRVDAAGHVQMEADFAIAGDGPMSSMFRRAAFDEAGLFAPVRSRGDVEMRERFRHYFGADALHDLGLPMLLCFAASTTLSQRVRSSLREHLQLFRTHIDRRPPLDQMRRDGQRFDAARVMVPRALRAPAVHAVESEEART